jgi:hypothetical protein
MNVRDAFMFITMNFSVDRFDFTADPRMTTIEDVIKAWKNMKSSPMMVKNLLGSMFLPETVNRLIARLSIMKPLDKASYQKIVDAQLGLVAAERLHDEHGRNLGQITVQMSSAYKKYLMAETVIPSEGARNTVVDAQKIISRDLNQALERLPRSSKYAKAPIVLTLDYLEAKTEVRVSVKLADGKDSGISVYQAPVALKFPSPVARGLMSPTRLLTAAHEFGHAFVAMHLGLRFEHVVVVPPNTSMGGYVKFKRTGLTAKSMMAQVYATVASRALERLVLSPDPFKKEAVLDITAGASQDIKQATFSLYNMIYELGFDPAGGTLDRNFSMGMGKYASYEDLPSNLAEALGLILRDMENYVLDDITKTHRKNWFVDRIAKLGKAGAMNEKEFYSLTGYTYPGAGNDVYGVTSYLRDLFDKYLTKMSSSEQKARAVPRGLTQLTVEQTLDRYTSEFARLVAKHLHSAGEMTDSRCKELLTGRS